LDQGIPALVESYGKRFHEVLPYPLDYPAERTDSLEAFSRAVTSSLIGGVGYFYGSSIVDRKFSYEWDEDEDFVDGDGSPKGAKLAEPKALLTATPSRSFFPRGFYWSVTSIHIYFRSDASIGMKVFIYCILDSGTMILGIIPVYHPFFPYLCIPSSLEILKDWIDLIDEDGWVAREQILGEEARSKVLSPFDTSVKVLIAFQGP